MGANPWKLSWQFTNRLAKAGKYFWYKYKRYKGSFYVTDQSKIRFAVIGLNHGHIYDQVKILVEAGAELAAFYAPEEVLASAFARAYPQAVLASSARQI